MVVVVVEGLGLDARAEGGWVVVCLCLPTALISAPDRDWNFARVQLDNFATSSLSLSTVFFSLAKPQSLSIHDGKNKTK